MSKRNINLTDHSHHSQCVVCGEPRNGNHTCSKEGLARFNRSQAAKHSAQTRAMACRYGVGLTFSEKLRDAFSEFHSGENV